MPGERARPLRRRFKRRVGATAAGLTRIAVAVVFSVLALLGLSLGQEARPTLPALPKVLVTTYTAPTGRTLSVRAGGDLQLALNAAQPGDVVSLAPGATFRGNFILPKKAGSGWIVVRSGAPDDQLPPAGTRVTPADRALMPKVVTPNRAPVIQTAPGAKRYRFIGIEFTLAADVVSARQIIAFGGIQGSPGDTPSDLIVDRCYVHGHATADVYRGILFNSAASAVIDSHVSEIHVRGADSQAILGYNGPGPFKIVNNYLEAAGENIMFGGGDPRIAGLVPSDIEVRHNHIVKPLAWRSKGGDSETTRWTVKNLLELKNAQRVLIEGNVLENVWIESQGGAALVLTPRSGGAAPWSVVQDVMIRNNIIRNAMAGFGGQSTDDGHPSGLMRRIAVINNLWTSVDRVFFTMATRASAPVEDLIVDHNTAVPTRYFAYDLDPGGFPALIRFQYTNNLTGFGVFGVKFPRTVAATAQWSPDAVIAGNVLVRLGEVADGREQPDGHPWEWDANSFRVVSGAEEAGLEPDGRLRSTSPLKTRAGDGKDPGVDFEQLRRAIPRRVVWP